MTVDRITRLNELIKQEVGEALYRYVTEENFDISAITITRVIVSRSLQHARVLVSIRGHEQERAAMLRILARHRQEMQEKINDDLHLKYTPKLAFRLDPSLEKGDHILAVLADLEREHPEKDAMGDGQESPDHKEPEDEAVPPDPG